VGKTSTRISEYLWMYVLVGEVKVELYRALHEDMNRTKRFNST